MNRSRNEWVHLVEILGVRIVEDLSRFQARASIFGFFDDPEQSTRTVSVHGPQPYSVRSLRRRVDVVLSKHSDSNIFFGVIE